ncbi:putative xyloglucan endotransglucosylase/hydrolase protein 32 [Citrus sinensis]|uniref:Xyloglucan endotransglucosylase/hydrolase protein 32 n=1 Tax=Citrus sinensis TaxID=2711 RepID=A0ACB8JQJ1_CITSI|nr:putative xyloglucan endotransglucosylase/hydrolase protein 32 [Citrus sinensis]
MEPPPTRVDAAADDGSWIGLGEMSARECWGRDEGGSLIFPSSFAYWPPSPDYWPSSKFSSMSFYKGFRNLWGPQHQRDEQNALTIWLDSSSGRHDEVGIEFLGTTFGKPYTLQTNVYIRGSGDGEIIGREMKFHLWFDPTKYFHHYAILWSPKELIFLVDDVPIRRYPRKSAATFPLRPMWVYGSYGMPHLGLRKMESTKLIIDTSHLLQDIPISKHVVAQPMRQLGAARSPSLRFTPVG